MRVSTCWGRSDSRLGLVLARKVGWHSETEWENLIKHMHADLVGAKNALTCVFTYNADFKGKV